MQYWKNDKCLWSWFILGINFDSWVYKANCDVVELIWDSYCE